jgi:hypothetical protein
MLLLCPTHVNNIWREASQCLPHSDCLIPESGFSICEENHERPISLGPVPADLLQSELVRDADHGEIEPLA